MDFTAKIGGFFRSIINPDAEGTNTSGENADQWVGSDIVMYSKPFILFFMIFTLNSSYSVFNSFILSSTPQRITQKSQFSFQYRSKHVNP